MSQRGFRFSALRWFFVVWFIFTLPIVAVLVINAQSRLIFLETLAHWRSKVVPIKYVFIGDSITAGGRNWGIRLWDNPLAARCLAESGFTVWQIEGEARQAIKNYHPQVIFIMAGVNDLLGEGDRNKALQNYSDLLQMVGDAHIKSVVTLVPYNVDPKRTDAITQFNRDLKSSVKRKAPSWWT
jgi:lysophospholipase L1-like esterase